MYHRLSIIRRRSLLQPPIRKLRLRRSRALFVWAWILLGIFTSDVQAQALRLEVSPTSLTFGFHRPNRVPIVRADQPLLVRITVEDDQGEGWRVTVLAQGDLLGMGRSIPINEITWIGVPSPPFINGRISRESPQVVAQGVGPARVNGVLRLQLRDRWDYYPGIYNQTIQFTLSSP